jgi:signal transduction histidine kinase
MKKKVILHPSALILFYTMSRTRYATEQALDAMNAAALAIAGNVGLDRTLRQIVESARDLAAARYAALGVPNAEGVLVQFIHSGMPADLIKQIGHLPHGRGLLGALLHEGRTIRIPRIGDDPRSVGFPVGHPPMNSFLGVPVVGGSEILGNLYLTEKIGADEFTAADQELIELLAAHAAIAIQNARLYEQVGQLAIIEERSRIGMDLHDGVIQSIYAVGLTLESVRLLMARDQEKATELLDRAVDGLNDAIRDIRNFIMDLRPHRFSGDLKQAVGRLVREFQANTMTPVSLTWPAEELATLPLPAARTFFLTTQEALANIARHARATQVNITLADSGHHLLLTIEDNGRGFDAGSQSQVVGHGLANMRARAEELKGTFELQSQPGQGTTLRLKVPLTT